MRLIIPIIFAVFLLGCSSDESRVIDWNASSVFESGGLTMRGEEGRFAILDTRLIAKDKQENTLYFWGTPQEITGKLTVTALRQDKRKSITIIPRLYILPAVPLDGADNHASILISLPESGLWRLNVYINEHLFSQIVIPVYE